MSTPGPSDPAYAYIGDRNTTVASVNDRVEQFAKKVADERDTTQQTLTALTDQLKAIDEKQDLRLALLQEQLKAIDEGAKSRNDTFAAQLATISSTITDAQSRPPSDNKTIVPLNPHLRDGGIAPTAEPSQRHEDGRINLHFGASQQKDRLYTLTDLRLKEVFPAVVLPGEFFCPEASARGKVSIPKELRLTVADATVLDKLEKIQVQLRTAMIPYELWPSRIVMELSGDFESVSKWAVANQPPWPLLIEAIVQVLGEHNALHSTVTKFSTLLPFKDEAYVNFAWRVRDAFYKLSLSQQNAPIIRSILLEKISTNQPSIFAEILDKINTMTTPMLVEEVVRRARVHSNKSVERSIYASPQTTVQLHGNSAPFYDLQVGPSTVDKPGIAQIKPPDATVTQTTISDPRTDERTVHPVRQASDEVNNPSYVAAANEKDNECFNCGKQGHWAKDCRSKPNWPTASKQPTSGRPVTLKGTLYDDKRTNLTSRLRNTVSSWRNKNTRQPPPRGRKGTRVHLVDPESGDDEERRDPTSRIEDDDDVDDLLDGIFRDIDLED